MIFFILVIVTMILGLCLVEKGDKTKFVAALLAILYFPLGVILSFSKKYK